MHGPAANVARTNRHFCLEVDLIPIHEWLEQERKRSSSMGRGKRTNRAPRYENTHFEQALKASYRTATRNSTQIGHGRNPRGSPPAKLSGWRLSGVRSHGQRCGGKRGYMLDIASKPV